MPSFNGKLKMTRELGKCPACRSTLTAEVFYEVNEVDPPGDSTPEVLTARLKPVGASVRHDCIPKTLRWSGPELSSIPVLRGYPPRDRQGYDSSQVPEGMDDGEDD